MRTATRQVLTPAALGIAGFDAFRPVQVAALERNCGVGGARGHGAGADRQR